MRTPMHRFGKGREIVGPAIFLASEASAFVTGEVIAVDGGYLASGVNCNKTRERGNKEAREQEKTGTREAMAEARKLRMGMVGGGPGAFIGPVHRIAAELDGKIELVAGAFSQSAERSREAGESFRIDPARAYADYRQMIEAERKRADGIDFVAIVTPNHLHLPVALAALEAGIPVMSDKPATATYEEALKLEAAVAKSGLPLWIDAHLRGLRRWCARRERCARREAGSDSQGRSRVFSGVAERAA
jgi:hypothetical protein